MLLPFIVAVDDTVVVLAAEAALAEPGTPSSTNFTSSEFLAMPDGGAVLPLGANPLRSFPNGQYAPTLCVVPVPSKPSVYV